MEDDSIDMVISQIDMGYLVTLPLWRESFRKVTSLRSARRGRGTGGVRVSGSTPSGPSQIERRKLTIETNV